MPKHVRTFAYLLTFLVIINLSVNHLIPTNWFYHHRVDYTTAKNSMERGLGLTMDRMASEIKQNPSQDYVILLGNSVMYSGPGGPEQSIGYYLEEWSREQGHPLRVYNLAEPGNVNADVYATILMLKEHGIPLKRVVVNQVYADFVPLEPNVPGFAWLGDPLRRLDPETWQMVRGNPGPDDSMSWITRFREAVMGWMPLWRDRNILRAQVEQRLHLKTSAEVMDVRPWTEKPWLANLMKEPTYRRFVDPKPFDMTPENPTILLLNRMVAATEGADVLFFFAPVNRGLLAQDVERPEYQANLKRVDDWFATQPIRYVNFANSIPSDLFTDHVHLTPEGYEQLARLIGAELQLSQ